MSDSTAQPDRPRGNVSRREFLRISSLAVGGAMVGGCSEDLAAPPQPTAQVATVQGSDLGAMARDVLESLGGIGSVVHHGEKVFIKPNMVTLPWAQYGDRFVNGECTKPEIVIAVAEECLKAGAAEVVIGDGSQMPTIDWEYARTFDGATSIPAEAERLSSIYAGNVTVASLETDTPEWVEVPSRTYLGKIAVSGLVTRADRVISIPVAKTHSSAQLTLSLKNFIGVTSLERYAGWTGSSWDRGKEFDHSSTRSIAAIYLDIVDAVKPDLAIIDFSIGLEGDGPTEGSGGVPVDMRDRLGSWLLLASTDPVAADATAARIMSHDVAGITQLRMAHDMGLGEIRSDRIEIIGTAVHDLRVDWEPARLRNRLSASRFSAHSYAGLDQSASRFSAHSYAGLDQADPHRANSIAKTGG